MSLLKRLLPAAAGPCRRNMSDIRTVTLIPGDGIGKHKGTVDVIGSDFSLIIFIIWRKKYS